MLVNCISHNTKEIFAKREHAVLGISPFNGYFTDKRITDLLQWGLQEFRSISVFVPDTLPLYNFLELGYTKEKAHHKSRRQANYLKNKIARSFLALGYSKEDAEKLVIDMQYLESNKSYVELKDLCYSSYENNQIFRQKCLASTSWILKEYSEDNSRGNFEIAVNYLLKEMPMFLDSPSILNVSSSVFIYHQTPGIITDLFNNGLSLSSKVNQGFIELNFAS